MKSRTKNTSWTIAQLTIAPRNTAPRNTARISASRFAVLAAAAALTFTGCSLESLAETAVERAVSAEAGQDVNLDFDSSSGGFTIETDEGSLVMDPASGEFVLTDADGETASMSIDDEGIVMESSSEGSIVFDSNSGEFVVRDETGEQITDGSLSADGEGAELIVESTDGKDSFAIQTGADMASEWPTDVLAVYPGATVAEAMVMDSGEGVMNMLTLQSADDTTAITDFYSDATESWNEKTVATTPDGAMVAATNGAWTTQIVIASDSAAGTTVSLILMETTEAGR